MLERVKAKLTGNLNSPLLFYSTAEAYHVLNLGTDFKVGEELEIPKQVARLIDQATNLENLCQHYIGISRTTNHMLSILKFETD